MKFVISNYEGQSITLRSLIPYIVQKDIPSYPFVEAQMMGLSPTIDGYLMIEENIKCKNYEKEFIYLTMESEVFIKRITPRLLMNNRYYFTIERVRMSNKKAPNQSKSNIDLELTRLDINYLIHNHNHNHHYCIDHYKLIYVLRKEYEI